ncbi:MAG: helix-turn-helix transcriptional regulator [Rhodospirillales bacterium]|nr:helix-turn-helix transcriptional regulator [Rhodospirillales bacterium]
MDRQWFRDRLHALGRTQAELARQLDLDASAVTRLLKGERQLKGAEAARLAALLECGVDEVLRAAGAAAGPADGFVARPVAVPQPAELPRNLPVFGAAVGGPDGAFEMNGEVHEFLERPPALQGVRNAYAVYVTGDSMRPMFQPGWVVHVNPNRPLTAGCGVVVQVRPADGEAVPLCYIKEFVRHAAGRLVVRQYNPAGDIEWPAERVLAVHRIVGVAEM